MSPSASNRSRGWGRRGGRKHCYRCDPRWSSDSGRASQWPNPQPTPSFANILFLPWTDSFVRRGCLSSLHLRVYQLKGLQNWVWLNLCVAFNSKGSTRLSAFCTLMYYYDAAYYFMAIFIFTYNYLHKFDEAAAVCLKCIVRKSKVENLRKHEAMVFCVCVRQWLPLWTRDFFMAVVLFYGTIELSDVNLSLLSFPQKHTWFCYQWKEVEISCLSLPPLPHPTPAKSSPRWRADW